MESDLEGQNKSETENTNGIPQSHLMLTVEEIKSYQIFSNLTDEQAGKVAESLLKFCIIASEVIDNQYSGLKIVKDKSAPIIQLKQSNKKAA